MIMVYDLLLFNQYQWITIWTIGLIDMLKVSAAESGFIFWAGSIKKNHRDRCFGIPTMMIPSKYHLINEEICCDSLPSTICCLPMLRLMTAISSSSFNALTFDDFNSRDSTCRWAFELIDSTLKFYASVIRRVLYIYSHLSLNLNFLCSLLWLLNKLICRFGKIKST